jgi:hypothetical protein
MVNLQHGAASFDDVAFVNESLAGQITLFDREFYSDLEPSFRDFWQIPLDFVESSRTIPRSY